MRDMLMTNATDVRKNWSQVVDGVIREKPEFIKRAKVSRDTGEIKGHLWNEILKNNFRLRKNF